MSAGPYLAVNGLRLTDLDLAIPYYGAPIADVTLSTPSSLTSPVSLSVGNLTLAMAIATRADGTPAIVTFAGVTTARLVGGAGLWRTPVALNPYRAPPGSPGVMLSRVLGDLATATGGESVNLATDRTLGPFFAPEPNVPASRILTLLAGALWWIDAKGVTQIAATRPTSTVGSFASVEHLDGGRGWATVSTEDPQAWVPGATYTGPTATIAVMATRVRADGASGTMRHEVLTS